MALSKERRALLSSPERYQWVDGINFFVYPNAPDVIKQLELVRQFEVRHDDVITIGFPRSGNHWAFEVVNMVVHQTTSFTDGQFYGFLLESQRDDAHAELAKMSSPRILVSHYHIHLIPENAVKRRAKLIYVLRNPKDVIVSLYIISVSVQKERGGFVGTWDEFLQLQLSGDYPFGTWFDHVLATEKFMKKHPECPVYIHVFEEMKRNPVKKIKELCSFLNKPDTLASQIAAVTEIASMKKELCEGRKDIMCQVIKDLNYSIHVRNGRVGDWKDYFTVAQNEMFNKIFEEKMAGSWLGDLIRQYIM